MLLESNIDQAILEPSLWIRFVVWLSNKLAVAFEFNAEAVTLAHTGKLFYESGILTIEGDTAPANERFATKEILTEPQLLSARLGLNPLPSSEHQPIQTITIPHHMLHFIRQDKVTQITAVNQLQQHTQTQQVNQHVNLSQDHHLEPVIQELKQYVDDSQTNFFQFMGLADLSLKLMENIRLELVRVKANEKIALYISKKATQVLDYWIKNNHHHLHHRDGRKHECLDEDIDLNQLPLGFFIEDASTSQISAYHLKFSDQLREDQLKDDRNHFRFDPAALATANHEKPDDSPEILLENFSTTLAKHNIEPSLESLQTLLRIAQHDAPKDGYYDGFNKFIIRPRYQTLLPSLYKQLQRTLEEKGKPFFLNLWP